MNFDQWLGVLAAVTIMTIGICSLKGCQAVYNPDAIRADADARILLHREFNNK